MLGQKKAASPKAARRIRSNSLSKRYKSRRSSTPGSLLGKRSRHPGQSRLMGDGGARLASCRPAALSVSEGPIGIPVLFCAHKRTDGKVFPSLKSQSSKNRCRYPYGGFLQPQKGVAPPCLTETPTISNQPSRGNFGVKRGLGLGCWRGRKRFGMVGCPRKHRRSIQRSPGVLLWANDLVVPGYRKW